MNLNKPLISLSGSSQLCGGEQLTLTSETAYAYQWSTGEVTQSITVSDPGTYTLIISNSDGILSEISDPIVVRVNPNPQISIDKTDVTCFGGFDGNASVVIISGSGTMLYNWSNNSSLQTASGLASGSYNVKITDEKNCEATASVSIIQPQKIEIVTSITKAKCPDAFDGQIELTVSGGTGTYTYNWTTGSNANVISNLAAGNYSVTVSDANNCQTNKTIDLGFTNEECFDVPGIITPNNDGFNDTWIIDGLELYPLNTVEIYNRYGKKVFYMKSYDNSWDGTFDGIELPMESYHYIINLNNGTPVLVGNITIVR
jgi:gliding motility-associated-like protein